uniref:Yippee domain-containing protein n=1 Tax=Heterorhabditis bacteriophora TaxID=37862 RepID=A0A1I7XQ08_HETBA
MKNFASLRQTSNELKVYVFPVPITSHSHIPCSPCELKIKPAHPTCHYSQNDTSSGQVRINAVKCADRMALHFNTTMLLVMCHQCSASASIKASRTGHGFQKLQKLTIIFDSKFKLIN